MTDSDPRLEVDGPYADFLEEVDAFGPDRAAARLRRLGVPEETLAQLVERFEEHVGTVRNLSGPAYMKNGHRFTWYTGPRPDDKCWPMLEKALSTSWDKSEIEVLDGATTRIVGLLDHPKTSKFETKGLVLGHVQSGKTTNFTGVAAKSADRGYRLFVVLAGIHNELRRQTQVRLVEHLVEPNKAFWHQLTKEHSDFDAPANAAAYFGKHSEQAVLCVIKKNATVLRKFIAWLREAQKELTNVPALVIDDEADQAAVATKTINPLILELLDALPKVAYVGYTATPFANLLIDPAAANVYPEDFIVDLPKPDGHQGTEVLFGREPLDGEDPEEVDAGKPMIRRVPDDEIADVRPLTKADVDGFAPDVDGTVRAALRWFWLATAARRVRGTGVTHSTMLVHTSLRIAVHESFRRPLERLRNRTLDDLLAHQGQLLQELRDQWDLETTTVPPNDFGETAVAFDELLSKLPDVIEETRVVIDNSYSDERLDYQGDPVVAIVVGGNTLSRGLTLEGLVCSYFVRSSTAYDTLLQMGRWFGYRRGYADLPRIWMTDELRRWFRHLAGVEAEVREDIARYTAEDETPLSFAVRIRAHPALAVTAAAKMRDAVQVAGAYGGMRVQTRFFRADDAEWLRGNQTAARALVSDASEHGRATTGAGSAPLWQDVPAEDVLGFLKRYEFHAEFMEGRTQAISGYIEERMKRDALRLWNVAVFAQGTVNEPFDFGSGVSVNKIIRSRVEGSGREAADIKTLMSRRDAVIDLALEKSGSLTEDEIRRERRARLPKQGLLVLYAIDRRSEPLAKQDMNREPLDADDDPIGVGLVFPAPPIGEQDTPVYWAADLARVPSADGYVEEEDPVLLDHE